MRFDLIHRYENKFLLKFNSKGNKFQEKIRKVAKSSKCKQKVAKKSTFFGFPQKEAKR